MRFAQVHKFAAYTLAVLGLVALGAGGELQLPSIALIALGVVASWFAEGELIHSDRYARVWNVALIAAFVVQVLRYAFLNADPLLAIVEFASLLQVLKLANRRNARDYQQITVLALLQLIAATVLGGGLSYAVCFVGFVIATPWAMTLGHLRREIEGNYLADARAGRAGVPIDVARILRSRRVVGAGLLVGSSVLSVPIFLLTAVIFVLFPRIGLNILQVRSHSENTVAGFGSTVDLTGHGVIRNDPKIVLRIEPGELEANPPPIRTFRLRGATFDTYNGRGWTRRDPARTDVVRLDRAGNHYPLSRLPRPGVDATLRVVLDPLEPPVVPIPEGAVGLAIDAKFENGFPRYTELTIDRDDGVRYVGSEEIGLVYTAYLARGTPTSPTRRMVTERAENILTRYLQLPANLPQRIRQLAEEVTRGEGTSLGKARAVERHLSRYRYTLRLESGSAPNPLEDFLFRSRAGHCEYFSTAMAVMLRTVGVPTRNVTGFLGGTFNRYGRFYEIHQGDAHSWVEVYDPLAGWVTFDPTPPAGEVPNVRYGVVAEVDAMVEALRMRWRSYVVDFDLGTQTRMAIKLWQFIAARRGRSPAARALNDPGRGMSLSAARIPWKRAAVGLVVLVAVGFALSQLKGLRFGASDDSRPPPSPAVRAAQELGRALDRFLIDRGHARPRYRSVLAFTEELHEQNLPFAPLAHRVAQRYVAARFGDDALSLDELETLRAELRAAASAPAA